MPQLDKISFLNQISWLVIFLGVLYFIIILIVLPKIHAIIKLRHLFLANILHKGYFFSNKVIKYSKFIEFFNYTLYYFNSILTLNMLFFRKITSKTNNIIKQYILTII
jgi:hypothetical protein